MKRAGLTYGSRVLYTVFVLMIAVFPFINGCGSTSSSSDTSTSTAAPAVMSQSLIDSDVMWAVNSDIVDIYNQNVAGKPGGAQNVSGASCPLGGTVNITGSASSSNGVTTLDLTYVMTNCKATKTASSTIELTLSGTIKETGSFNSIANYKNMKFLSTPLTMIGTVRRANYDDAAISETCDYSSTQTQNYTTSGETSGTICGRSVSWTWGSGSGDSSGGTGGTGGTSGTGTTNGSCSASSVSCGGNLQCSQAYSVGSCSVQSCTCYYTNSGSDSILAWYKANSSYYCCDINNGQVNCTAAAQQVANVCAPSP